MQWNIQLSSVQFSCSVVSDSLLLSHKKLVIFDYVGRPY